MSGSPPQTAAGQHGSVASATDLDQPDAPVGGRALDDQELRERVRWQVLLAAAATAVGVVVFVLFLAAASLLGGSSGNPSHSTPVDATVTQVVTRDAPGTSYARVQFQLDGAPRISTIYAADQPEPLTEGQQVRAYVNPENLMFAELEPPSEEPGWAIALMLGALVVAVLALAIGPLRLVEALRLRRLLASSSWQPGRIRVRTFPQGNRTVTVALLHVPREPPSDDEHAEPAVLRVVRGLRPTTPGFDVAVLVAGDPARRVAVRTADDALGEARRLRLRRSEPRWRRRLETAADSPLEQARGGEPPIWTTTGG